MTSTIIRIATRKSPLALWQANHVGEMLIKHYPDLGFELVPFVTSGDKFLQDSLVDVGGKGLFVKELEQALMDNKADIAVHSTKDMPAHLPDGLCLSAICQRDNPLDALVSPQFSSIENLPQGAIVGTASLRRQFQLLALRPDLQIKPLRGNINTRLTKLENGEYQAIILAAAGLERMGFDDSITELISDELMLPACGQGALSIETRTNDNATNKLISALNHAPTALCVSAERAVNAQLGGNCRIPFAVYCTILPTKELFLRAKLGTVDGHQILSDAQQGAQNTSDKLAQACTDSLIAKGANQILGLYQ